VSGISQKHSCPAVDKFCILVLSACEKIKFNAFSSTPHPDYFLSG
jgi:hypothetical protein